MKRALIALALIPVWLAGIAAVLYLSATFQRVEFLAALPLLLVVWVIAVERYDLISIGIEPGFRKLLVGSLLALSLYLLVAPELAAIAHFLPER